MKYDFVENAALHRKVRPRQTHLGKKMTGYDIWAEDRVKNTNIPV